MISSKDLEIELDFADTRTMKTRETRIFAFAR